MLAPLRPNRPFIHLAVVLLAPGAGRKVSFSKITETQRPTDITSAPHDPRESQPVITVSFAFPVLLGVKSREIDLLDRLWQARSKSD